VPDIGLEDDGSAAWIAEDAEALEAPAFVVGIAALDGIACPMIEVLPLGGAHGQIAEQAQGSIAKGLCQVEDLAMGAIGLGIGARLGWVVHIGQLDGRGGCLAAGLGADPLVALAFAVVAVGDEGLAIRTDRAAFVVIASDGPAVFVVVAGVTAEIDEAASMQVAVDRLEEEIVAKGCVSNDGFRL
jgi:hypothetical protein